VCVASWPAGPDWPKPDTKAARKKPVRRYPPPAEMRPDQGPRPPLDPPEQERGQKPADSGG
jgi:hypothetical protein